MLGFWLISRTLRRPNLPRLPKPTLSGYGHDDTQLQSTCACEHM